MDPKNKKVYISLSSIFMFCYILTIIYFIVIPQDPRPEGQFILPGDERFEQLFAAMMVPLSSLSSGLISIFIFTRLYLKKYAKSLRKYQKVGLVTTEELSSQLLWRKLLIRATISGLFIANICYIVTSQEIFVIYMRSAWSEHPYIIPDASLLFMLIWIAAIPCTCVLVPVWLTLDAGVVVIRKINGYEFNSSFLAQSRSYKVIKGFVKIGFIINFTILISLSALNTYVSGDEGAEIDLIMILLIPFLLSFFMIPLVVLIDSQKDSFRTRLEQILIQLDMYKELICNYELKDINSKKKIIDS